MVSIQFVLEIVDDVDVVVKMSKRIKISIRKQKE